MKAEYFQWGNELETGIRVIDEQHYGLVEIINELIQMSFRDEAVHNGIIKEIYGNLTDYVYRHFRVEENLMEHYQIDARHKETHYQAHHDFNHEVATYFSDLSLLESPDKLGEVAQFLIRWLAYHILSMDRSLARQIENVRKSNLAPNVAYEKELNVYEIAAEPLLKALKALFFAVSEKNKELAKLNNELEEKITLRTLELQRAYDRLEHIAMRDELTGLFNRRHAINQLESSIKEWKRYGVVFSVLFVDVDKFKAVNDTFGHDCGDKVLTWIAAFLLANTRRSDIVCRFGGDEFVVICNHCDGKNAIQLAEKLHSEAIKLVTHELSQYWNPSLSIGVVEVSEGCPSAREIIMQADQAMYVAKSSGGNSARLVSPSLAVRLVENE